MLQAEWRSESLHLAQAIKQHAEQRGTEAQWDGYVAALDHKFTAVDEALIDRLVPPGHPSTPGFSDPAYPIEGRVARTG